jgi:hypothetical protein
MSRIITVAAAQLGPIQRNETRGQPVSRLIELLKAAKSHGCVPGEAALPKLHFAVY